MYSSLAIGGMVFPGYDSGFQPSLAFFQMAWCVWMLISVLSFGIARWISEYWVEVVSRFIPKGLGTPQPVFAGYMVKLEGGVSV